MNLLKYFLQNNVQEYANIKAHQILDIESGEIDKLYNLNLKDKGTSPTQVFYAHYYFLRKLYFPHSQKNAR